MMFLAPTLFFVSGALFGATLVYVSLFILTRPPKRIEEERSRSFR